MCHYNNQIHNLSLTAIHIQELLEKEMVALKETGGRTKVEEGVEEVVPEVEAAAAVVVVEGKTEQAGTKSR